MQLGKLEAELTVDTNIPALTRISEQLDELIAAVKAGNAVHTIQPPEAPRCKHAWQETSTLADPGRTQLCLRCGEERTIT